MILNKCRNFKAYNKNKNNYQILFKNFNKLKKNNILN